MLSSSRQRLTVIIAMLSGFLSWTPARATEPILTVYKTPTCGCCSKWVEHLRAADFTVETVDLPSVAPIKKKYGVPEKLASCHTAVIGDTVVEGHVPASVVRRFLKERPPGKGLAVRGMPIGSPGMEGPNPESYDVWLFDQQGHTEVYSSQ